MKSICFALLLAHLFALVVIVVDWDLRHENSPDDEAMDPREGPAS